MLAVLNEVLSCWLFPRYLFHLSTFIIIYNFLLCTCTTSSLLSKEPYPSNRAASVHYSPRLVAHARYDKCKWPGCFQNIFILRNCRVDILSADEPIDSIKCRFLMAKHRKIVGLGAFVFEMHTEMPFENNR